VVKFLFQDFYIQDYFAVIFGILTLGIRMFMLLFWCKFTYSFCSNKNYSHLWNGL